MTGSRPAAALDPHDELVRRAARGDEAAFARLVRLHTEAMTRVAYVVTGDREAAAGAVEAAWIEAWPGLHRRPSTVGLGSWLASLAAERAIALARGEPADDPAPPSVPVEPGQVADAALATALATLCPEHRAHLALLHVAGLTGPEVAATRRLSRMERLATRLRGFRVPGPDAVPGPAPDADPSIAGVLTKPRLRAYAAIAVRPIDADALARRARAEATLERRRVLSVGVAAVVGGFVALHPYLAMLAFGG